MNLVPSPICTFCGDHKETLEHLLISCTNNKNFWLSVTSGFQKGSEGFQSVSKGFPKGFQRVPKRFKRVSKCFKRVSKGFQSVSTGFQRDLKPPGKRFCG